MANKWDDEFDFMEEGKKGNKKKDPKKGSTNAYGSDDFGDLEDEDNGLKLPSIGGKNTNKTTDKSKKNLNQVNLEQIGIKKDNNKSKASLYRDGQLQEEFQESIAQVASPVKPPKREEKRQEPQIQPPKVENEYDEENYEEENYEEDFQTHQQKKPQPAISKAKANKTIQPKANLNIPQPASKARKGAESVAKKSDTSARVYSRNSARSYDKSSHSKTRVEERKEEGPNKYTTLAEKQCPQYDRQVLQGFSLDKLTRQNQRVRNAIKMLNDSLNDLINKNINQLKTKKVEKEVNQQEVIKQLEEQKNSNEIAIQNSNRDLAKLKTKQGTLKEEEYHLSIDERIIEAKNSIVQCGKIITKLKYEVDSEGKRLTKIDKSDKEQPTIEISNIKIGSINAQKQFQKNEEILQKLDEKLIELTKRLNEVDSKHSKEMEEAKQKGISVIINPELIKKFEELKKKTDLGRNHNGKIQTLNKTKCDMVVHEIQQVKTLIKQIETNTLALHANCEEVQGESKKVVEKARRGTKTSQELLMTLDTIIIQMERGGIITSKENIDDQATFTHPKGAKKYQSAKNVDKVPVTPPPRQPEAPKEDPNLKKPQLFKKKKQDEKQDQRVWTSGSPKTIEKGKEFQPDLARFQDKEEKNDEKKKPFVIKKKDRSTEEKIESPKEEKKEEKKEVKSESTDKDEVPSIAPRMKIFKRNKEEPPKEEPKVNQANDKNYISKKEPSNDLKIESKQEDEKPSFVPRRFNLKVKDRKNEDSGYVASTMIENKQKPKVEEQKEEEYKPRRFNIQKTDSKNVEPSEPVPQAKPELEQEKPKINLRLKDRQKELNRQENIEENISPAKESVEQPQPRIMVSLNDNPNPSKENSNPYAQAQEAPKREREGRVKKQKPAQNAPKQQFNIYEQAEDLTNVKSLEPEEPKPSYSNPQTNQQELDLNKMLGINKNKNAGFDDLLTEDKPAAMGNRKEKKESNFFGDLQL